MDRKVLKKMIRSIVQQRGECQNAARVRELSRVHDAINERGAMWARIQRVAVDGQYGVLISGMDCDCVRYSRGSILDLPTGAMAAVKFWDDHCSWLDGPESQHFVTPALAAKEPSESRDLALEAFEDGHPHVVFG